MIPPHSKVFRLGLIWALIFSPLLYLSQSVQAQRAANPVPLPGPIAQGLHPPAEDALRPEAILRTPEMRAFVDTQHRVRDAVFGDNLEPTLWWEVDIETVDTDVLTLTSHHGEIVFLFVEGAWSDPEFVQTEAAPGRFIDSVSVIDGEMVGTTPNSRPIQIIASFTTLRLTEASGTAPQHASLFVFRAEEASRRPAPELGERCGFRDSGRWMPRDACGSLTDPNNLTCIQFVSGELPANGPDLCLAIYRLEMEAIDAELKERMLDAGKVFATAAIACSGVGLIGWIPAGPLAIIAMQACMLTALYAFSVAEDAARARAAADRAQAYADLQECLKAKCGP